MFRRAHRAFVQGSQTGAVSNPDASLRPCRSSNPSRSRRPRLGPNLALAPTSPPILRDAHFRVLLRMRGRVGDRSYDFGSEEQKLE